MSEETIDIEVVEETIECNVTEGGSTVWGMIGGDIANQPDLAAELATVGPPFPSVTTAERNELPVIEEGDGVWDSDENTLRISDGAKLLAQNPGYTVSVYSVDDLPDAVDGVITLAANTKYVFGGLGIPITLTDKLVLSNRTTVENAYIITSNQIEFLAGGGLNGAQLVSTAGSGDFIIASNTTPGVIVRLEKVNVAASDSTYFNLSSSVPSFVILDNVSMLGNGNTIGTISGFAVSEQIMSGKFAGPFSGGFTFNNNNGISLDTIDFSNGFSTACNALTFGGTAQNTIQIEKAIINNNTSGVYAFNFPATTTFNQTVQVHAGEISDKNKAFAVGSNTQNSPKFTFRGVGNIPDTDQLLFVGIDSITPIGAEDVSLDYNTRVLTVTPPLGYFYFYVENSGVVIKYTKIGSVSFQAFPDVTGRYRFYFDSNGEPQYTTGDLPPLNVMVPIWRVLWNATLSGSAKAVVEVYEGHQNTSSPTDNEWKGTFGTVWKSGGVLAATPTIGTPNASGVNTCVGFTSITNIDENLKYTIENSVGGQLWQQDLGEVTPANITVSNGAVLDVPYLAGGVLPTRLPGTRFPFDWNAATNIPQFITPSGVRTQVSNLYYFVYFDFVIQDPRYGKAVMTASSGAEYSTLTDARAVNWEYMTGTFPLLADSEIRPIDMRILQYKTTYPAAVKYTSLVEATDLRKAQVVQTTALGSVPASSVTFVPIGNISATNAQSAIAELDTEKEPANANIQAHIASTSNPHSVTYSQVGAEPVNENIQAHIGSTLNPHSVTYSQVGAEQANANIQAHISSTSNPHSVTKTQIGLSNVENTALSTWAGSTNITTLGTITGTVEILNAGNQLKLSYSDGIDTTFATDASGNTDFTNTGSDFDFGTKTILCGNLTLTSTAANLLFERTGAITSKHGFIAGAGGVSNQFGVYDYVTAKYHIILTTTSSIFYTNLKVQTPSDFGSQALTIDQDDADQAFIDYQGTSAASVANNITTWTTGNSIQGFVKIEINGTAYWMPYYNAPGS